MNSKFLALSIIFLISFSLISMCDARTLTVYSVRQDNCGPGQIIVKNINNEIISTTNIDVDKTSTVNLPNSAKKVEFHSIKAHTYKATLNNLQEVFTSFPNANFDIQAWFYSKYDYKNKIKNDKSGYLERENSIDAWKVTTLANNSKFTDTYGCRAYYINTTNKTNPKDVLFYDNIAGTYKQIPNGANLRTLIIQSQPYYNHDYTVQISIYSPGKDIAVTRIDNKHSMRVSYNGKTVVATEDNPHIII